MNRIYSILFILIAFCSCNPMDDIYDNLDGVKQPIADKINYTLSEADYKKVGDLALGLKTKEDSAAGKVIKEKLYFAANAPIAKYLPSFLKLTYPGLQTKSSMMVTYNYNEADYPNVGKVVLSPVNYKNVGGNVGGYLCFMASEYTPSRNDMTKALKDIKAEDGEFRLVTYNQAIENTTGKTQNVVNVVLDKYDYLNIFNWVSKNKATFVNADKNAEFWFGTGTKNPNFDVRVDKWTEFPHTDAVNAAYVTSQVHAGIIVALKSKYAKSAVKDVIYNVKYAIYDGKNKVLTQAFKCTVDGSKPDFEVYATAVDAVQTEEISTIYQYSKQYNNWSSYTAGFYILTSEDYKGIGMEAFTSANPANNYLPQFLSQKYPYAQPGDELVVVTKNDNGKLFVLYTDRYAFTDGVWVKYNPVIVKEDQFIYKTGDWVFDPTVSHSMVKSDYDILVQWVKENKNGYFDAKYNNAEYWFGASTYKDNFDIRLTSRLTNDPDKLLEGKSEAETSKILNEQIQKGIMTFLEIRFPTAEPTTKEGLDMYYKINYLVFDGSNHYYVVTYKCVSTGKFELSEEPSEVQ